MYFLVKVLNKNYIINSLNKIKIDNSKFVKGDIIIINKINLLSNKKKFLIISKIILKKIFIICFIFNKIKSIKIFKLKFKKRKNYIKKKNYKPNNYLLKFLYINLYFLKLND